MVFFWEGGGEGTNVGFGFEIRVGQSEGRVSEINAGEKRVHCSEITYEREEVPVGMCRNNSKDRDWPTMIELAAR